MNEVGAREKLFRAVSGQPGAARWFFGERRGRQLCGAWTTLDQSTYICSHVMPFNIGSLLLKSFSHWSICCDEPGSAAQNLANVAVPHSPTQQ
jgi:hypothetical protein